MQKRHSAFLDELPEHVLGVRINAGFRSVLRFYEILESDASEQAKAALAEQALFPDGAEGTNKEGFLDALKEFLTKGESGSGGKSFCFRQDSYLIYVSFLAEYGIDLLKADLHWWVFLELFKNLSPESTIKKVIDIRTKEINAKDSAESRIALQRAKTYYALDNDTGDDNIFV